MKLYFYVSLLSLKTYHNIHVVLMGGVTLFLYFKQILGLNVPVCVLMSLRHLILFNNSTECISSKN